MLTLPPGVRVFVATSRVDGRRGIDGLSALVRSQFAEDPLSGSMCVFFSRRADRVRVLYFDRDCCALITKRLEIGTFRIPWSAEQRRVVIEAAELLLVLEGTCTVNGSGSPCF
jgi:transposase